MKLASFLSGLALLAAFAAPTLAVEQTPEEMIGVMSRDVLDAVRADRQLAAGDRRKGIALAEAKILPHIDFEEATRLAAGRAWALASAAQRERLVGEFRALLVRTYANASAAFQGDTLKILPARGRPQEGMATVRTQFMRAGGQPLPIDFHARRTERGWMIYDIVVEGVSLVMTYRSDFDAVVKSEGVDGLIRRLGARNAG